MDEKWKPKWLRDVENHLNFDVIDAGKNDTQKELFRKAKNLVEWCRDVATEAESMISYAEREYEETAANNGA